MDFYRESLNFPNFREVGADKMNPFNYQTPEEYLHLQDKVEDGFIARAFFYNALVVCRDNLGGNYELFWALSIMRAVGIKFVPHSRFGFVIKPIEDDGHWSSGQYEDFKAGLKKYQNEIIYILSKTGEDMKE